MYSLARHRGGALRVLAALFVLAACQPAVEQPQPPKPAATAVPAPSLTPGAAWADLDPYRAAMRPEFAHDVDALPPVPEYRLALTVTQNLQTVIGRQAVRYVNTAAVPLDVVYFRLLANTPVYGGHTAVSELRAGGVPVTPTAEIQGSALRVPLPEPLAPGAAVELSLEWTTQVPTHTVSSGYNHFGFFDGILALPNVYPVIPVYDAEGWNVELAPPFADATYTPAALYRVTLTAPADQVVATSGVCQLHAGEAQTKVWECASGPMRDFMIAMSAGYQVSSQEQDGIKVSAYYLAKDAAGGASVLRVAAQALAVYERRFGPYPFNELDVVETPTSALGIEYPGLVAIAERVYGQTRNAEATVAHEVAHQWWYGLVGNDQLDEPWLDEALAQYSMVLYYRDVDGADAAQTVTEQAIRARYNRVLEAGADLRADLPAARYSSLQYGGIVYGKAALFFDALDNQVGDARFDAALQAYFNQHRYGIAHKPDLLAALATEVDPATLDRLVRQWITGP